MPDTDGRQAAGTVVVRLPDGTFFSPNNVEKITAARSPIMLGADVRNLTVRPRANICARSAHCRLRQL